MAILEKQELVNYLITKHKEKYPKTSISSIKLQKGLYFLYAFWGGKMRSARLFDDFEEMMVEMELSYDEDLFNATFEAWAYGPVDKEVYIWFTNLSKDDYEKIYCPILHVDEIIIGYIDDLIHKILNTNDFTLIDIAQEDECWKQVYDSTKKNKIDNDAIKKEYSYSLH